MLSEVVHPTGWLLVLSGFVIWFLGWQTAKRQYLHRIGDESLLFGPQQGSWKVYDRRERGTLIRHWIGAMIVAGLGKFLIGISLS